MWKCDKIRTFFASTLIRLARKPICKIKQIFFTYTAYATDVILRKRETERGKKLYSILLIIIFIAEIYEKKSVEKMSPTK